MFFHIHKHLFGNITSMILWEHFRFSRPQKYPLHEMKDADSRAIGPARETGQAVNRQAVVGEGAGMQVGLRQPAEARTNFCNEITVGVPDAAYKPDGSKKNFLHITGKPDGRQKNFLRKTGNPDRVPGRRWICFDLGIGIGDFWAGVDDR